MFTQSGPRPLWPAIVFLPWLFFGVACLLYAARGRLRELRSPVAVRVKTRVPSRTLRLHAISLWGFALLAVAQIVQADPSVTESRVCQAATPQEARTLADRLFAQGEYQRAGQCYQAAGDLVHANLAFLKAAEPAGQDSARDLKAQRDSAKALFSGVAQAFAGKH